MSENIETALILMVIVGGCVGNGYVDAYKKIELRKLEIIQNENTNNKKQ